MKTCCILRGYILGIENMILKYQSKKATSKIMFAGREDENVFLKQHSIFFFPRKTKRNFFFFFKNALLFQRGGSLTTHLKLLSTKLKLTEVLITGASLDCFIKIHFPRSKAIKMQRLYFSSSIKGVSEKKYGHYNGSNHF